MFVNNDGFGSVSVKWLNNDGGERKLLNVGGGGGSCSGGSGIKLWNVGGGGGCEGGWKLLDIAGSHCGDILPLLPSQLFLLKYSLLLFNLFSLFCMT